MQAPQTLLRGDPDAAMKSAPHRLSAEFTVGGQEHFYLEGQIAFALPGEDGDIVVHTSTQHPTEVQHICARLLGCDFNRVTAVVRRLGGGFGGKESNASWVAGAAALAANQTGQPVKLRLPREIDMIATGKRHPFLYRYTVGFDGEGRVLALDAVLAADAGWSLDLTPGVVGARAHPHRQRLLDPAFPRGRLRLQDAQAVEHRVPRLRRAAGRGGHGGCARPHRPPARPRSDRGARAQFLRARADETPFGQKVEGNHLPRLLGRGEARGRLRAPPRRDRRLQQGRTRC